MAAFALRVLLLILFPSFLFAQSLTLSVSPATQGNGVSTFLLNGNKVTVTSDQLHFAGSGKTITNFVDVNVSADKSKVGILQQSGEEGTISVFDAEGDSLTSYSSSVTLSADDPSKAIYAANNGQVLLRDNITNFTFYDLFGEIATSVSNSSGSKQGEKISQVVGSKDQSSTVIYNPKIKRDGDLGSRIQTRRANSNFKEVFYSRDRYLKDVAISDKGDFLVLITAKSGTQDKAVIMDYYGNVLQTISVDDNLQSGSLSSNHKFITLYSSTRVMVYSMQEGERIGSTSLDGTVFLAEYFPEDNLILALSGDNTSGTGAIDDITFEAINLEQRSISSKKLPVSIGFSEAIAPGLIRVSDDEYRLVGGNKVINIGANF